MAALPRLVLPVSVTDFEVPGPFISVAQSGRINRRANNQRGRSWTETFMLKVSRPTHRQLLAFVREAWRSGLDIQLSHLDYLAPKGVGGGNPVVDGAGQTGSVLNVRSAPADTVGWLLAGDIISLPSVAPVLEVTADVDTDVSGGASIPINPPLLTGESPGDGAAVTISGVTLTCVLLEPPDWPESSSDDWGSLTLTFRETL